MRARDGGRAEGPARPGDRGGAPLAREDLARFARISDAELERDCEVRAFRATGPGGQGVNTTDSAVRMRHLPTGIVVVSRASRSQHQNRCACLRKLRAELERRSARPARRVKTRVSASQKRKRLEAKRMRSEKKAARRRVDLDG